MGATLPAALFAASLYVQGFRPSVRALRASLTPIVPQIAIVVPYLLFRLVLLAERPKPWLYTPVVRWTHLADSAASLLVDAFGSGWALGAGLVSMGLAVAVLARRVEGRALVVRWLLPVVVLCLLWMLAVLAPFVAAPQSGVRFAMPLVAPVSLLFGAHLSALWRIHAQRQARVLELVALACVVASAPYSLLLDLARNPRGADTRRFADFMQAEVPELEPGTHVVLLYGGPDLAGPAEAERFIKMTYGGALIRTLYPRSGVRTYFHSFGEALKPRVICHPCVYIELLPGGDFSLAEHNAMSLTLEGLRSQEPFVVASAAIRLVAVQDDEAIPLILESYALLPQEKRERVVRALLLVGRQSAKDLAYRLEAEAR